MSMRANPTVIGVFVVGAVVLLLAALLVWGGSGWFRTKLDYVLFFESAVTGLNKGAPVLARGVKVGEVTDVQLRWGTPLIGVYISVEPQTLKGIAGGGPARAIEQAVRKDGLRGQLRMQSFVTGVLYVALDVYPGTPIVLRGLDPKVPELPTVPTDIEVWTAKLEKLAAAIEKVPLDHIAQTTSAILDQVKTIVESKDTHELFRNANGALVDARRLVGRLDVQIDPLLAEVKGTLGRLDRALDAAQKLVLTVDGRVDPLANQAEGALKAVQGAFGDARPLIEDLRRLVTKVDAQADPLLTSFRSTLDTARAALEGAQVTLAGLDRTLDQESPLGFELFSTLKEFRAAAQALRSLADYLERVPDAPVYGLRRPSGDLK
ncbi:MAG TPA: MlaD family protein [Candidatus Methylomirabilis sp.]|nr:MlaD family protein [Candidatus Methylomirabilis sp.]